MEWPQEPACRDCCSVGDGEGGNVEGQWAPSGSRRHSEHLQMRSSAPDVLRRGATWRDTSSLAESPGSEVTHPCPRFSWEERSGKAARLHPARCREKQTCFQQVLALRSRSRSLSPPAPLPPAGGGVFLARLRSAVGCARQQSRAPGDLCWESGIRVRRPGSPESLCPRNNLARVQDERGLNLSLSNPSLCRECLRA